MMPFVAFEAGLYDETTHRDALEDKVETVLQGLNTEPLYLPLGFLKAITNDFSPFNLIGSGGFGQVYRGNLKDGKVIAVKKLNDRIHQVQNYNQFQNEVTNLVGFRHQNVVQLVGYCVESRYEVTQLSCGKYVMAQLTTILFCFEYLSNGSLDNYISDEHLDLGWGWEKRYGVIHNICRGLQFLHEECNIVHMDLKPPNILMDDDMVAKISDFGLSRFLGDQSSKIYTDHRTGTNGYMAPEYILHGKISQKADIYSLGVIMIEIMTGSRKNPRSIIPRPKYPNENNISRNTEVSLQKFIENELARWKIILETSGNDGPKLEIYTEQVKQLIGIALKCVDNEPGNRPSASEILEYFNQTAESSLRDLNCSDQQVGELLSVYPLQLQFSFVHVPKRSKIQPTTSSLYLTNNTDKHVAFRILTEIPKEYFLGPLFGFVPPSCRYTLAVTMRNQQNLLLDGDNLLFTVESTIGSIQDLLIRRMPFFYAHGNVSSNDAIFIKAQKKDYIVHQVKLTAIPARTEISKDGSNVKPRIMIMPINEGFGRHANSSSIDVHPTKPWIMTGSSSEGISSNVNIWDYHMQEMVCLYGGTRMENPAVHRYGVGHASSNDNQLYISGVAKFIAHEPWIVIGQPSGEIVIYSYMAMRKVNSNYMAVANSKAPKTYMFSKVKSFLAHDHGVSSLEVHPTRPFVLSSASYALNLPRQLSVWKDPAREMIKMWDWKMGWECIWKFDMRNSVNQLMFNPMDSNKFVSVSGIDDAKVWNICSANFESTLPGTKGATCFDFFIKGDRLCLFCAHKMENKTTIWDYHDIAYVKTLRGQATTITASSDPELPVLVTGSSDGTVRVWNSSNFSLVHALNCGLGAVNAVACLSGSRRVAVVHSDGVALVEIDHERPLHEKDHSSE
ncbi:unnamed protein product [Urochloa decumbens]|uniref:non-specific serine/threonine protein kinase n=1 Tax=Urochloa decumbens TaxID=240449 RepID=A0ABC9ASM1_9POAL